MLLVIDIGYFLRKWQIFSVHQPLIQKSKGFSATGFDVLEVIILVIYNDDRKLPMEFRIR